MEFMPHIQLDQVVFCPRNGQGRVDQLSCLLLGDFGNANWQQFTRVSRRSTPSTCLLELTAIQVLPQSVSFVGWESHVGALFKERRAELELFDILDGLVGRGCPCQQEILRGTFSTNRRTIHPSGGILKWLAGEPPDEG
jgi:hypothetical protein